jgi:hypothetical protein
MDQFPSALPHGELEEIFPDVFFITGTMKTVLMGADWHFSRNMTVVRDGDTLTLINTVRLNDAGLLKLEGLGRVANIVKIGWMHGQDDAFYKSRYGAVLWAIPGMQHAHGLATDKELILGGDMPFDGCSVFSFRTTKQPEGILRIDRAGGILVSSDSLQNWLAPDEFFSHQSRKMMAEMGFFRPANVGPLWMQLNEPKAEDFLRLRDLPFRHALCGHGVPLRDTAKEAYTDAFHRLFDI